MNNYKLGDLIKIHNGTRYSHLAEGEIPVYGSGGVMCYVNDFLYDGEAILLPRKGTLDNIMYSSGKIWTIDTMYYATVNEKANPYYLYRYLTLLDLKHLDSGSALPSMTQTSYTNLEIKLPHVQTQQKIASVLSSLDSKIELNNRINLELEQMAKLLYDYWFVQFEFPPSTSSGNVSASSITGGAVPEPVEGRGYKSSCGKMVWNEELKREIPVGWKVKPLLDFCSKIGDGIHGTPEYVDRSDYSFINGNNLKNGFIEIDFDTKNVSSEEYERYYIELNEGTILLSINGTLGNLAVYTGEKVMLGKSAAYINCKGKNRPYCYQFLKLDHIQKKFWNIATGSTIKNLSLDSLKNLLIPFPGDDLIDRYFDLAQPIDAKRTNIFKENQQLATLRDWLLPMLMNGQVTVGAKEKVNYEVPEGIDVAAEPGVNL